MTDRIRRRHARALVIVTTGALAALLFVACGGSSSCAPLPVTDALIATIQKGARAR